MPVLKQGSSGPEVTALQAKLKQLGFDLKEKDGIFGSKTKAALIAFQKSKGLTPDGIGGRATMAALEQSEGPADTNDPQSSETAGARESNPSDLEGGDPLSTGEPRPIESQSKAQLDRIVDQLVDGNEEERARIFRQIQTSKRIDKPALAARLRAEIEGRFSPRVESEFATATRDPKRISSIRSWMISSLIWTDAETSESRNLLLRHLRESNEPDRVVRFWTLGGLYQRNTSFLAEALKRTQRDKAPEVAALQKAIARRHDVEVIEEFKSTLASGSFGTSWPVLRLLRVVAFPELAQVICEQLARAEIGSPLAYDSLFALAQPEMAREAVKYLSESPGVEEMVKRVIAEARGANQTARRNFTLLLAVFERSRVERSLTDAETDLETRDTARLIRNYLNDLPGSSDIDRVFVAGYASDTINVKEDDLGIQEDVHTLTAVMLAKEVEPPLAIGLFGDWGTGKSFFMKSMRTAVDDLAARSAAPNSRFCANIAQIEFNAWHYVDTNLWASLVSYILEQLAAYVTPALTDEEQQAKLLSELGSAKAIVAEAEAEKQGAEQIISNRQQALQEFQIQRQQKELKLRDLRMADLATLLSTNEPLKKDLEKSLNEIGVPTALTSVSDLSLAVSEAYTVRGRALALFMALVSAKNRRLVIGLLVVVLLAIPGLAYLAHKYLFTDSVIASASAIIAQVVGLIVAVTTILRRAITTATTGLAKVETAKQQVDRLIAAKRETPTKEETDLQNEIASLKAKEQEAAARVTAAAARVVELEERIRAIKEGRSLARFLVERTRSEDYRKHLGLISTIRKDFESLTTRLATARLTPEPNFRAADRIILYIDDLDRCPEDKVMDVLQAVHLLLAYPLFVVVVGVDPRWLLHSLGTTLTAFKSDGQPGAKPSAWRTTPQNYLEKIFQIPFNLRRMTSPGYGKLISKLLSSDSTTRTEHVTPPTPEIPSPISTGRQPIGDKGAAPDPKSESEAKAKPASTDRKGEQLEQKETKFQEDKPKFVIQEESLVIKEWEAKFAVRLFPLIPSPRAAKRFSNVYRILKARVGREDLAQFEGTEEFPGDFQVPMLLLAMLIGAPAECAALFPKLQLQASAGDNMAEALQISKAESIDSPESAALMKRIEPVVTESVFPNEPDLFLDWIPRVSRFSFEVGRVLQATSQVIEHAKDLSAEPVNR
ncbi:MAG: P-loop NTPase fold protein [Acidobacteriota bacterium]